MSGHWRRTRTQVTPYRRSDSGRGERAAEFESPTSANGRGRWPAPCVPGVVRQLRYRRLDSGVVIGLGSPKSEYGGPGAAQDRAHVPRCTAAQLASGVAGMVVGSATAPYDVFWMHGRRTRSPATPCSRAPRLGPVSNLLTNEPSPPCGPTARPRAEQHSVGGCTAGRGYLGERLVRQRLRPSGGMGWSRPARGQPSDWQQSCRLVWGIPRTATGRTTAGGALLSKE